MRWKDVNKGYADRITAMSRLTPHELLGVAPGCTHDEMRSAYIRLVKAYHPDKADPFMARHNEQVIKLINAAYEKLKDGSS